MELSTPGGAVPDPPRRTPVSSGQRLQSRVNDPQNRQRPPQRFVSPAARRADTTDSPMPRRPVGKSSCRTSRERRCGTISVTIGVARRSATPIDVVDDRVLGRADEPCWPTTFRRLSRLAPSAGPGRRGGFAGIWSFVMLPLRSTIPRGTCSNCLMSSARRRSNRPSGPPLAPWLKLQHSTTSSAASSQSRATDHGQFHQVGVFMSLAHLATTCPSGTPPAYRTYPSRKSLGYPPQLSRSYRSTVVTFPPEGRDSRATTRRPEGLVTGERSSESVGEVSVHFLWLHPRHVETQNVHLTPWGGLAYEGARFGMPSLGSGSSGELLEGIPQSDHDQSDCEGRLPPESRGGVRRTRILAGRRTPPSSEVTPSESIHGAHGSGASRSNVATLDEGSAHASRFPQAACSREQRPATLQYHWLRSRARSRASHILICRPSTPSTISNIDSSAPPRCARRNHFGNARDQDLHSRRRMSPTSTPTALVSGQQRGQFDPSSPRSYRTTILTP